ncbi:MAG: ribonuclease HII [Oscillospiraceae bacterium]|nr:ribonuclease HII [Oscillospiraceae bacterium]
MTDDLFEYDRSFRLENGIFCGIDEAGRGPLAGDVYAAAVVFDNDTFIDGINDSKKLSEKKRAELYDIIIQKAAAYSVGTASAAEIDEHNILRATFIAMRRAYDGLGIKPSFAIVDGNRDPGLGIRTMTVVKGDGISASIAAASIIAKVSRDRYMTELAEKYPEYQFKKHKGYPTKLHYEMIRQYGPSPVHRMSFLKKMH